MTRKHWTTAAAILVIIGLLAALFSIRVRHDMEDFAVNEKAARRMSVGETLYRVEDEHWQFKYMPAACFLYLPLTAIDRNIAKVIWFLIVVFSCVGLVLFSRRLLPQFRRQGMWISVIPALVLLRFFLREIELGQINALVTLILLFSILQLLRAEQGRSGLHNTAAGLLWGLAVALKPYSVIFLPYFIVTGRWRSLLAGIGVLGAAVTAPALFYGWSGNWIVHREWLSTLSHSTPMLLTSQDNISLPALFAKWTGGGAAAPILAAGMITGLALLFFVMILRGLHTSRSAGLEGAALLTMTPMVSPLGWDYTLLMGAAGVTFVVAFYDEYPAWGRRALAVVFCIIALSLYDIMGESLYAIFMRLSIPTVCFLVVVAALARIRFRSLE